MFVAGSLVLVVRGRRGGGGAMVAATPARGIVRVGDCDFLMWHTHVDGPIEDDIVRLLYRPVVHLAQLKLRADVQSTLHVVCCHFYNRVEQCNPDLVGLDLPCKCRLIKYWYLYLFYN